MSAARPGWVEYGLMVADTVSARADCTRRKVGAVLMASDHSIVGTGYNGSGPGGPSCLKGQCPRGVATQEEAPGYDAPGVRAGTDTASSYDIGPGSCIALHAEQNVLLRASWDQMKYSTLFVTCKPCPGCMRMLAGTPLKGVYWRDPEGRHGTIGHARITNGRFLDYATFGGENNVPKEP